MEGVFLFNNILVEYSQKYVVSCKSYSLFHNPLIQNSYSSDKDVSAVVVVDFYLVYTYISCTIFEIVRARTIIIV